MSTRSERPRRSSPRSRKPSPSSPIQISACSATPVAFAIVPLPTTAQLLALLLVEVAVAVEDVVEVDEVMVEDEDRRDDFVWLVLWDFGVR